MNSYLHFLFFTPYVFFGPSLRSPPTVPTVEVVVHERIQHRTVEQFIDIPVPQPQEEIVHVPVKEYQDRHHHVEVGGIARIPEPGGLNRKNDEHDELMARN